eukprot:TRINITY_DN24675_c0_g1_i1.p1 TRINITY_DN24675_c0_g1~~TRINITY_DN24675_c0_g1_i1.p1  ORF type:complete len:379 (-),score=46.81 TRINITY_DN24675_c0_g1_i1:183-1319(-)
MASQFRRQLPTPARAKRVRCNSYDKDRRSLAPCCLPDSVLSTSLAFLSTSSDLAAVLCVNRHWHGLEITHGAWSALSDLKVDTDMLQSSLLNKRESAISPVKASMRLRRWKEWITSDELPGLLAASLSAHASRKESIGRSDVSASSSLNVHRVKAYATRLAELPGFVDAFSNASRVTRAKAFPSFDCDDFDLDDFNEDDGPILHIGDGLPGYGKVSHEVSCSIKLFHYRISLRASACCEADEGDVVCFEEGQVNVTKLFRLNRKSKHSEELLSWNHRSDDDEHVHRTFNVDAAERLTQDLASGCALERLPAHDMPLLLAFLLASPFRGTAPPHGYAFAQTCWGKHLHKEFVACSGRSDSESQSASSSDSENEDDLCDF